MCCYVVCNTGTWHLGLARNVYVYLIKKYSLQQVLYIYGFCQPYWCTKRKPRFFGCAPQDLVTFRSFVVLGVQCCAVLNALLQVVWICSYEEVEAQCCAVLDSLLQLVLICSYEEVKVQYFTVLDAACLNLLIQRDGGTMLCCISCTSASCLEKCRVGQNHVCTVCIR